MLSHACRTEVAAKYVVALQPTVSSNTRHGACAAEAVITKGPLDTNHIKHENKSEHMDCCYRVQQ